MRDGTMIKLGLLFMLVTTVTGVNYSITAYNTMMDRREAPRAFVVNHVDDGQLEIGVLGQRLTMPDPVKTALAQAPVWQVRAAEIYFRMLSWVNELQSGLQEQKNRLVNN